MLTRKKILLTLFFSALAVRLVFAASFFQSFFASYHLVPGLDMQTLLRYSEWIGENNYPPFFTFHRLAIFLTWFLNSKIHAVWAIFAIQSTIGILGTLCIADLTLKFTRHRIISLITGIAASFYLPFLVYEFSILKESFAVNFMLFTFWSMIYALRKRFNLKSMLLFGFCCFLTIEGRIAVIPAIGIYGLYCAFKMYKRKSLKRVFASAILPLILLISAAFFNSFNWKFSPFFDVLNYNLQYNTEVVNTNSKSDISEPVPVKSSRLHSIIQTAKNASMRMPQLFKTGELPENQNIYFWCRKIPQFNLFISPGLLIPCAVAGIMVLLITGAWKTRYGILLIPVITLALPLCAREVIGRYRLMLVPYFFMISACAAVVFIRLKSPRKRAISIFGAGVGVLFSFHNSEVPEKIRLADHGAYAIAAARTPGADPEKVIDEHLIYWEESNYSSQTAFDMLMDQLLRFQKTELLRETAVAALCNGKIPPDTIYYFTAWSYALDNQPQKVWEYLVKIKKLPPDKEQKAIMLINDTKKILNNR